MKKSHLPWSDFMVHGVNGPSGAPPKFDMAMGLDGKDVANLSQHKFQVILKPTERGRFSPYSHYLINSLLKLSRISNFVNSNSL